MPVSMRLLALTLFLLCVNVTLTKCLSQRSILSCAVGIKSKTYFTPNLVYRLQLIIKETKVDRAASKIAFYLHTKENTKGQIITTNDKESLKNAFFNPNRPTRIITHGYWNSKDSIACTQPLNAFLASGDYNVIVLDWWDLQNLLFGIPKLYTSVVGYVADVSKAVTEMLNFLEDEGNNPMTTKLIGHSLGAHIMGMASYFARRKVDHIIGLDPALPSFESKGPGERLSTDDANTVEVIHTNEGSCGITEPIGHFDFYPNGGSKQPGCWFNPCAHSRSIEFYAEAINSESGFFGRKCHLPYESVKVGNCTGSIVKMGEAVKKRSASEGVFYLRTNKAYPFATGV